MSKSRSSKVKREMVKVRIPLSSRPNKVQTPKTTYNRKVSKKVDDTQDYSRELCDSISEVEDLVVMGKLSKARVNSMIMMLLCRQPKTIEEYRRREEVIERLDRLLDSKDTVSEESE